MARKIKDLVREKGIVTRYRNGFFNKDVYREVRDIDKYFIYLSPNIMQSKDGRLKDVKLKVGDIIKEKVRPSKKYKNLLDIETEVWS